MNDGTLQAMKKRIIVLGSTGSIGVNTLSVAERHKDLFEVVGLSCGRNIEYFQRQVSDFQPEGIAVADEMAADEYRRRFLKDSDICLYSGGSGMESLVREIPADILVNGVVGAAGLLPTLAAIKKGMNVALANKETMVIAGELVTELAKEKNVSIFPIDSEHSAIWQCLAGESCENIERLYLTGSGGPFLHRERKSLASVTVEEALAHPRWSMGKKITIDSATLMNKGLEIIEARWLFGIPPDRIDVVIHPESIIHSMVEFVDGSIKAQMGVTDMYLPIQLALSYPQRLRTEQFHLDIFQYNTLHFLKPDREKFPSLNMALEALNAGGTAPAVLNASNEEAVMLFLEKKVSFVQIFDLVRKALDAHEQRSSRVGLDELLAADAWARQFIHLTVW